MSSSVRRVDKRFESEVAASLPALRVLGVPQLHEGPGVVLRIEARFQELAARWYEGTRELSSLTRMIQHPAYRAIVAMGWQAVPLLLRELAKPDPDHWGPALRMITGEQPVPREDAGRPERIAEAWHGWAARRGLRWQGEA